MGLQTVVVATDASSVSLGETFTAVVTIGGDPDRKVRGAKVQLVRNAIRRYILTNVTDHGSHERFEYEDTVIDQAVICLNREATPGMG